MAQSLGAMIILALGVTLGGFYLARPYLVTARLWKQTRPYARPDMALAAVQFSEPSLVWEFRQVITNHFDLIPISQATNFLRENSPRILVLPTAQLDEVLKGLATNTLQVRAKGFDSVQFKRWDLTAIVKQ